VNITHGQFAIDRQVTVNTGKAKQDEQAATGEAKQDTGEKMHGEKMTTPGNSKPNCLF
jgi:hypothetical protein